MVVGLGKENRRKNLNVSRVINAAKALDMLSVTGDVKLEGTKITILAPSIVDSCWNWMLGTSVFIIQLSQTHRWYKTSSI